MLRCVTRPTMALLLIGALFGCRPSGPGDGDTATADSLPVGNGLATTKEWCGKAGNSGKCTGQLEDGWDDPASSFYVNGKAFHDSAGRYIKKLGYGRIRARSPFNANHPQVLVVVSPMADGHKIQPDKIGSDVVYGVMFVIGPNKTEKFGLDPADSSSYWMILNKSETEGLSTWRLERLYFDSASKEWKRTAVFKDGKWRTCPKPHPQKDYAYADFASCDDVDKASPDALDPQMAHRLIPNALNDIERSGDDPIWIFCAAGCCEADQ